jgi:hypothetical protein
MTVSMELWKIIVVNPYSSYPKAAVKLSLPP